MVHCYIRTAKLEDIFEIRDIHRQSFPTPWSDINYWREQISNRFAHYLVACEEAAESEWVHDEARLSHPIWLPKLKPESFKLGLIRRLFHEKEYRVTSNRKILGFTGLLFVGDEAYLAHLAVRRSHRRCGIGELLLNTALDGAIGHKSQFVTTEVHISNEAARGLYKKYGFKQVRLRQLAGGPPERGDYMTMIADGITCSTFQMDFQSQKRAYQLKYGTRCVV